MIKIVAKVKIRKEKIKILAIFYKVKKETRLNWVLFDRDVVSGLKFISSD